VILQYCNINKLVFYYRSHGFEQLTSKKWFSPREEALEIAYQARKDILSGKADPVAILRACVVIANNLNKTTTMEWVNKELSGYKSEEEPPNYRIMKCPYSEEGIQKNDFYEVKLHFPVHYLAQYGKKNEPMTICYEDGDIKAYVSPLRLESLLDSVVDKCLQFLNEIITELQYGGIVEFLMEEIRQKTDERLAIYNSKITEETQSLYLNLTSTNPADWNKVGHSCRKILKLFADSIFPPRDEKYKAKDGRVFDVGDQHFINRLYAFLDQKVACDEKKFLTAQIGYVESYLRQVVDYAQMAEHNPSIEKFHADMLAIHTYLILSEILRHTSEK
jgi:hypothetical protein